MSDWARLGALSLLCTLVSSPAAAFGGVFLAAEGREVRMPAVHLVVANDDQSVVVTMHLDYVGDPEDFVLLVPIAGQIIDHRWVDSAAMSALAKDTGPILVPHAEIDPCLVGLERVLGRGWENFRGSGPSPSSIAPEPIGPAVDPRVPAVPSTALRDTQVVRPEEVEELLRRLAEREVAIPDRVRAWLGGAVAAETQFLVITVKASELRFAGTHARLPALRVHYRAASFTLHDTPRPAGAVQDVLVHTLSAESPLTTTAAGALEDDLMLSHDAATTFADTFDAVFTNYLSRHDEGSLLTEFSRRSTCQRVCDSNTTAQDRRDFGGDVLESIGAIAPEFDDAMWNVFITRLHTRVAAARAPIDLTASETTTSVRARFRVHRAWDQPIECDQPIRGDFARMQDDSAWSQPQVLARPNGDGANVVLEDAIVSVVAWARPAAESAPEPRVDPGEETQPAAPLMTSDPPNDAGCGCRITSTTTPTAWCWLCFLGLANRWTRRRLRWASKSRPSDNY